MPSNSRFGKTPRVALVLLALVSVAARQPDTAQHSSVDPSLYSGLRWRMLGPFRAGRVYAVTEVPGNPATFYFGSVGGGVWKAGNAHPGADLPRVAAGALTL